MGDKKKMRRTQDGNFLKQCKRLALNLRLEPEKAEFNGPDQKHEKMTASIKERENKLCDREDSSKTKELSLKAKKNN